MNRFIDCPTQPSTADDVLFVPNVATICAFEVEPCQEQPYMQTVVWYQDVGFDEPLVEDNLLLPLNATSVTWVGG
ncbi:MAG: hypothetical protein ACPG8W_18200 [Candidatus Promineifilaceae bacterium]